MRVYIWYPTNNHQGHASLELSSGTYISFWDRDVMENKNTIILNACGESGSLKFDSKMLGQDPQYVISVGDLSLDEEKMETWWNQWKETGTFGFYYYNSFYTVYQALRQGGAAISINPLWTAGILYRYLQRVKQGGWGLLNSFFG